MDGEENTDKPATDTGEAQQDAAADSEVAPPLGETQPADESEVAPPLGESESGQETEAKEPEASQEGKPDDDPKTQGEDSELQQDGSDPQGESVESQPAPEAQDITESQEEKDENVVESQNETVAVNDDQDTGKETETNQTEVAEESSETQDNINDDNNKIDEQQQEGDVQKEEDAQKEADVQKEEENAQKEGEEAQEEGEEEQKEGEEAHKEGEEAQKEEEDEKGGDDKKDETEEKVEEEEQEGTEDEKGDAKAEDDGIQEVQVTPSEEEMKPKDDEIAPPIVNSQPQADAAQSQEVPATNADAEPESTTGQQEAAEVAEGQQEVTEGQGETTEGQAEQGEAKVEAGEEKSETKEDKPAEEAAKDEVPSEAVGDAVSGDAASAEATVAAAGDQPGEEKMEEKKQDGEGDASQKAADESVEKAEAVDGKGKEEDTDGDGEKEEQEGKEEEEKQADKEGEEGGEEGEEKTAAKEEEPKIPEDFYYNFEDHASKAVVAEGSGLPLNMLALQHSYGYDCKKRNNLHLMDEKTVIFASGNLVQILDLKSKEMIYLRSTSGCGIGAVAVHPSRKFVAVGEKGDSPNINIFEFPSLKLYRILRGGTEESYTSLTFSPDGELLASQGGEPDFMLTLWNWREEKTTLRTKSFSQDVFRVSFAGELEGQLTTAGSGHIRFWKMADTFTGLKLQGELGRFGRTEISDIEGYVELPDGKVLSGAEWGNLLLWDGGLIKVEITRKGKKSCHQGPIMQILLDEGELMTVGVDGYIRVWDFEAIDTADSSDDSGKFEMDPMNELKVASNVHLYTIVKSVDEENEPTIWYAQDANGGIWKLDLSFSHTSMAPEKMFTYHAGTISGCVSSPLSHVAVTAGRDKTVRVFDYKQHKQLSEVKFNSGGTSILWSPLVLDSKGSTVLVGFDDGVVRSLSISRTEEESLRKHEKSEAEIALKQAFKPHNGSVTAMAFDGKGEFLATGSSDGTVFFLFAGDVFEPIGFIQVPGPVRQLVWTPEKFKKVGLMVVCEGGQIVEVEAPEPGNFDTSHSYQISGLSVKQYTFKSIKSHLRHEEDLERQRIEEIERKKKEEEERRKRIERGLETESEQGDDEGEITPSQPAEDWHPFIPEDPSPVLHASYSDEEGKFWLSMGEFDAGYLYECKFTTTEEQALIMPDNIDKPLKAIPVQESMDVPIHVMKFSKSGQQVLMGMANGQIRIQQLDEPNDLSMLGPHFTLNMHDNNYGHVTSIVSSFDGKTLLSTGADGSYFQFSFMEQEELDEKIAENKAKLPSARKAEERDKVVDDIDDPKAYSIEDAKQKSEHDKMMKEAEQKKKDVRKQINQLRRQFRTIIEQNENMPRHLQLSRMEFEMDREIKLELEQQTQEKKDLVRKELAWESEKLRLSLEKLRKKFKDVVECERIVVKAFTTSHEVTSYRASKLSDDFYSLKADFERRKTKLPTKDEFSRDPTRDLAGGQKKSADGGGLAEDGIEGGPGSKVTTTLKGSMGERINNALQKVEEKKKKRAARKALWEELYSNKPDDDYEDPHDVAAIKEAQENMGDYKLKTALDYVVPDHLRMNVEKARGRLLAIKDMIHEYKYIFNVKLLALRDNKIRVIDEIRSVVNQMREIQSKLHQGKHLPLPKIPEMHPDEMPEKILEYTRETLKQFKIEYEEKQRQVKLGGGGGGGGDGGGFGFGFGGGGGAEKQPSAVSPPPSKQATNLSKAEKTQVGDGEESQDGEKEDDTLSGLSPLERELHAIEQIKLAYEQTRLLNSIQEMVKKFDAELRLLRHDKFRLDILMKDADLRQVTLFEELVLLKEYEKSEDILAEKVGNKQQEKTDMQGKILEVQGKIDSKKKDIEKCQEKERALMITFGQSLGDNNKFADYLTKVFKKRVKRTKKKDTEGDGSDEDSDEDSSDDSDWEESDEESESETGGYDLDVCPPGCDQKLYDDTCTLREKRLDIEELLAEEKKNQEAQKKELESLQKKAKVIESQLKTAQNDLEDFQLEKQQKLNELTVVATLKLHQVQHITKGTLHHDLSPTLVFESDGVVRLQYRIKELEHEKLSQKRQMRESKRKHVQLIKDRRVFEAEITEKEGTCLEMMLAKFGSVVDLEQIETVTVNRAIEELKEKLRQTEYECSIEMRAYDEEMLHRKEKITTMVRDNTQRLTQLAMLLTEQNQFTNSLDNRQRKVGAEFGGQRKTDVREKQRLIQLVQLQAQEIDALKEEIMLLSRKGGHILPPAQPPLPQSPANFHPNNH